MITKGKEYLNEITYINSIVLPISYNTLFYNSILKKNPIIIGISHDKQIVGGIIGWKEKNEFILGTLAILSKYCGYGYGRKLMDCFLDEVKRIKDELHIQRILVHVHDENDNAKGFYTHFGFVFDRIIPKAYPRFNNPKALVYIYQL